MSTEFDSILFEVDTAETFFDSHVSTGLVAALEPIGLRRRIGLGETLRMDKPYRAALDQGLIYTRLGNPLGKAELAQRPGDHNPPRIR